MAVDLDAIAELSGLISECRSLMEYEAARLEWLERAVGFNASYFGAASPQQLVAPVVSGVDARRFESCETHADRYWQDRATLHRAALDSGGAVADHDALSLQARDRMPFYREVMAAHGIRATAVALLHLRGQVSGCMSRAFRKLNGAKLHANLLFRPCAALHRPNYLRASIELSAERKPSAAPSARAEPWP